MKSTSFRRIAALGCCAALGTAGLTACGSTTRAGTTAAPSAPTSSPASVVLDEHANHTTVHVGVGTTVRVDLHSTYWSRVTSSAPQSLAPTDVPSPSATATATCRPGGGCGTVTGVFVARAAGSVQLTSQRTSCGEAKPCPPDQQTFTVAVEISR